MARSKEATVLYKFVYYCVKRNRASPTLTTSLHIFAKHIVWYVLKNAINSSFMVSGIIWVFVYYASLSVYVLHLYNNDIMQFSKVLELRTMQWFNSALLTIKSV